jgi:hypothetical protein
MGMLDATVMVKCLSVLVTTWTSYALYHTIWVEMFYGIAIDFELYTAMLTAEIVLVVLILLAVLVQCVCMSKTYDVKPYISLFSTSAAAIIGITTLLVLMYNPGSAHGRLSDQYEADLREPIMELHSRLRAVNVSDISYMLFGHEIDERSGVDMIEHLPHGPLMYIFLSSLFTVAYTAPMVLLKCYKGSKDRGYNERDTQNTGWRCLSCFNYIPVWPSVAVVQLVIAGLVLYSWMFPSVDLLEVVMILAVICGLCVSLIALYTIYTRTRTTGCVCLKGCGASFDAVEGYYTNDYLHLLVAVAIANIVQASAAIMAYDREVHSSIDSIVYIGCVDVMEMPQSPAHKSCVLLLSTILALTFRVLLIFYFIAILVLRTVELTQLCRHKPENEYIQLDNPTATLDTRSRTTHANSSDPCTEKSWDPFRAVHDFVKESGRRPEVRESQDFVCVCAARTRRDVACRCDSARRPEVGESRDFVCVCPARTRRDVACRCDSHQQRSTGVRISASVNISDNDSEQMWDGYAD